MKRMMLVVIAAALVSSCEHGLPVEQQNEQVKAVVSTCWSSGGTSYTYYAPDIKVTTVSCHWQLGGASR